MRNFLFGRKEIISGGGYGKEEIGESNGLLKKNHHEEMSIYLAQDN